MANVLGLITARGGSKGVPGKNIAPCGGRPLIAWTCDAAGAACITRKIVSTDDAEIARVCAEHGVDAPFVRPAALASDSATSIDVANHALDELAAHGWVADVVVLLQPTSPLRTAAHVDAAFARLAADDDAVVSVIPVPHRFAPWSVMQRDGDGHVRDYVTGELPFDRMRRQGQPTLYARNGPAVVVSRAATIRAGSFYGARCAAYEMSTQDSIDIDDRFDLELADWLLRRRG